MFFSSPPTPPSSQDFLIVKVTLPVYFLFLSSVVIPRSGRKIEFGTSCSLGSVDVFIMAK